MMVSPRSTALPLPPDSELEILVLLHQKRELDAMTIRAELERFRPMSHASVSTLLHRLEARGLVKRRKADRGKTYLYSASVGAETTYKGVIAKLLERVFHNNPAALVSALLSVRPPTDAEAEELRGMVEALHSRKKKGRA
ncbi:MAG: BlaI/MecI/CopY family transcriptional regulator [Vicinamibacteria bacterium]